MGGGRWRADIGSGRRSCEGRSDGGGGKVPEPNEVGPNCRRQGGMQACCTTCHPDLNPHLPPPWLQLFFLTSHECNPFTATTTHAPAHPRQVQVRAHHGPAAVCGGADGRVHGCARRAVHTRQHAAQRAAAEAAVPLAAAGGGGWVWVGGVDEWLFGASAQTKPNQPRGGVWLFGWVGGWMRWGGGFGIPAQAKPNQTELARHRQWRGYVCTV